MGRLGHAGSRSGRKEIGFFLDVPAVQVSALHMADKGDPMAELVGSLPRAIASHHNRHIHRRQIDAVHAENWQISDVVQDLFETEAVLARHRDYGDVLQREAFTDFTEDRQEFRTRERVHLASGRWSGLRALLRAVPLRMLLLSLIAQPVSRFMLWMQPVQPSATFRGGSSLNPRDALKCVA